MIDEKALREWIRGEIKTDGMQKTTAARFGLSKQFLNDIVQGHRTPGEGALAKMGWRRVVRYERIDNA